MKLIVAVNYYHKVLPLGRYSSPCSASGFSSPKVIVNEKTAVEVWNLFPNG